MGGDPLSGVERVFVDGNNLLHALARGTAPGPPGAIVGRIRAAFPSGVAVDLVFDGPSAGLAGRVATGMRVSYAGRHPADRVIRDGVAAQLAADGPAGTWGILVVTDDRELRDAVRGLGARTAGTTWLAGRVGRDDPGGTGPRPAGPRAGPRPPAPRAGTTIGHRRPPRPPAPDRD